MTADYQHVCCAAQIALEDLEEIERQLSRAGELDAHWLLLVKQCLVAIANMADLERTIRSMYKANPELSAAFRAHQNVYEFAKYVRNQMIGHVSPDLIDKAIEWKPELHWLLQDSHDKANILINLYVLETALNTYVDEDEKHLVFEGDTDLSYPPDWQRFLGWLTSLTREGIAFLKAVVKAAQASLPLPPSQNSPEALKLFTSAGATKFSRITKGR
jgi:hypothetical protein